ncbi:MAG: HU family DNA-binding protein [Candidatus Paracaedibacteraceae bacterium]|nr:HU family DNA-binding protein [Candidatus Paracaedibacteraceae bacterium]
MNKTDLIKAVANHSGAPTDTVNKVFDALFNVITNNLKNKEDVSIPGFGKFKVSERAARKGRNPQTGAAMDIAASTSVTFSAGKALKEAVN